MLAFTYIQNIPKNSPDNTRTVEFPIHTDDMSYKLMYLICRVALESTALLYCSTALLLYCSTDALLYCSTDALLYCFTAVLLYCCTVLVKFTTTHVRAERNPAATYN